MELVPILRASCESLQEQLSHLHLFVAQGTQYYRYIPSGNGYSKDNWEQVYNYPLTDEQVAKISKTIEESARELGFWEEDKLAPGDEIIENRLSQVTFSALGQKAGTEAKYAWDPDCKKREAIVKRAKELAPAYDFEIGGTTSINAITPGMNKVFGMTFYSIHSLIRHVLLIRFLQMELASKSRLAQSFK